MAIKKLSALILVLSFIVVGSSENPDYRDALHKSLLFFQAQRSGVLPLDQEVQWRGNSGLKDGLLENVDLVGGYYDAGDNMKFGFPMAFTTTMLAWSVLEFGRRMQKELVQAREAVRWGSDYLLKASSKLPYSLYIQVGNPSTDHKCWERPEDMTAPRNVYKITPANPGTEVAAETAAALAAASIVFRHVDKRYSATLREAAEKAFAFADEYRGKYSDSLASVVCPFYCSTSGFQDELLWGAAWLYKATRNSSYLHLVKTIPEEDTNIFSWDSKIPGVRVLLARDFMLRKNETSSSEHQEKAEEFMCRVLPSSPLVSVKYTPWGLLYMMNGSNTQYVTSTSFFEAVYAKYLRASGRSFKCGDILVTPSKLRGEAKKQVDYILGANPKGLSYMVGYGDKFPRHVHHRGSSMPSIGVRAESIGCGTGVQYLIADGPNPNELTGAVVGGPDEYDGYSDDRSYYEQSEPAIYINAPLVGILAYMAACFQR